MCFDTPNLFLFYARYAHTQGMKRMLSFLKGYRAQAVLAPLFKLMEAVLELLVPLVVADIIDHGIPTGDTRYILIRAGILVAIAVVGFAFSITAQWFSAKTAVGYSARLKSALFGTVTSMSYRQIDQMGVSRMLTRMGSDAQQVQNGINMFLRLLLRSPFVVFGALVMALIVDPSTAWLLAVVIPVLGVIVAGIVLGCLPRYKAVQEGLDGVTRLASENLSGARVVRAFAVEEEEKAKFERQNRLLMLTQRVAGHIGALLNPLTYLVVNGGIIALLWVGGLHVDHGSLTQGETVAIYNYMATILVELVKLANLILTVTRAVASGRRISQVLAVEPDQTFGVETEGKEGEYAVEFEDASLQYVEGAQAAVDKVTLRVKAGETVGVVGSTGSGKTSLLSLLPRFYDATEGRVLLDGRDVKEYTKESLRSKVHVVAQHAVVFGDTVRGNLLWGDPDATDEELWQALAIAQVDDVVRDKGGLDALLEEGGRNLSGGQRQRISIARALVGHPRVLILDDSSSALDNATDRALREAIATRTDCTLFVISQRTTGVRGADKILVLDDGQPVGLGTHEGLLDSCQVYREIFEAQGGAA